MNLQGASQIMSATTQSITIRRAERGQTLIVALAVLFILLFIGGFFVARVAGNLVNAARSVDTQGADTLAKAGLEFCNQQINTSPEGADWRPTPSTPISNSDPDYYWLEKGFFRYPQRSGRALVRVGYDPNPDNPNGEMLRIEAIGRVGDVSAADNDPTVFVSNGASPRLRRELVAYKAIGITNFARYITGKERRTESNFLGTPPVGHNVATILGNPMLGETSYASGQNATTGSALFGYPMYVNGDLALGSDTYLYEGTRGSGNTDSRPEKVFVNGSIDLAIGRPRSGTGYLPLYTSGIDAMSGAYLNLPIGQDPGAASASSAPHGPLFASSDPANFTTHSGLVTDNNSVNATDTSGFTRNVPRLDPPRIDTTAYNTSSLRYETLTRDSGFWYTVNGREVNAGQFGYGQGVYVDNLADRQKETQTTGSEGGLSLRGQWLNPNLGDSNGLWQGPFYNPPGLTVQLLGDRIRLTRSDGKKFYNTNLTPNAVNNGTTLDIPLSDLDRDGIVFPGGRTAVHFDHAGDDPKTYAASGYASPYGDKNSYGVNVVLYAEGNVRVRGVYGAITNVKDTSESGNIRKLGRVHLTIVSGGTAYIDGNVVRGDGYVDGGNVVHMERASTCAILAHDYVTVNTTQFMKPLAQATPWAEVQGTGTFEEELRGGTTYDTSFSFGIDPSDYTTGGNASEVFLMLRHSAMGGASAINLFVNPGLLNTNSTNPNFKDPDNFLYHFNEFGPGTQYPNSTYPGNPHYLGDNPSPLVSYLLGYKFQPGVNAAEVYSASIAPNFESKAFPLNYPLHGLPVHSTTQTATDLPLLLMPGYENLLRFNLDTTLIGQLENANPPIIPPGSSAPYALGGAAVAPLDIRIEATLYAQERSFFIIPGYSLNPDSRDDRQHYIASNNVRLSYSDTADTQEDRRLKDVYPFSGEPGDIRITLFGSIAENYTASVGDQAAWMRLWGYIPSYYGSTNYYAPANRIQIPDVHLAGWDPKDKSGEDTYAPGQDRTLDYRTPLMNQKAGGPITANGADIETSSGLRFVYDPALAMPYVNPTDTKLFSWDAGTQSETAAAITLRKQRALRYKVTYITVPGSGGKYTIVQILPGIPNLPVCPNTVYSGNSDRLLGSGLGDTDKL